MIVKLLTEHHLEILSLKGGCRGSSESTLVKMSNCWKSHATAHEPVHEISNNVVCATSKASDQPVHTRSLIRAYASHYKCLFQSLLQDISSHQRIVDSVVEKAQGVLQSSSNPDVANFITEVSSRYETLAEAAKVSQNLVISTFCLLETPQ